VVPEEEKIRSALPELVDGILLSLLSPPFPLLPFPFLLPSSPPFSLLTLPVTSNEAKDLILESFFSLAASNKLPHYNIPRGIIIETKKFTPENGKLTPSFKTCRRSFVEEYGPEFEKLFLAIEEEGEEIKKIVETVIGVIFNFTFFPCSIVHKFFNFSIFQFFNISIFQSFNFQIRYCIFIFFLFKNFQFSPQI
jgi:hypothetical protein